MAEKKTPVAVVGHAGQNGVETSSVSPPEQNGKVAFDSEYDRLWALKYNNSNAAQQAVPPRQHLEEKTPPKVAEDVADPWPKRGLPQARPANPLPTVTNLTSINDLLLEAADWADDDSDPHPPARPMPQVVDVHPESRVLYRPIVTRLSDVRPEAVEWLWPGRIALGKLTLVAGDPGLGKSFLSLDLGARVSRGVAWPDDPNTFAPLGGVVLLSAEDALGDTVRPRLDAMGADVSRIIALEAVQGDNRLPVNLQRDLPAIEQAIEQVADCRLVIIDPISSYLGRIDSHNNADIRGLLHPLGELADRAVLRLLRPHNPVIILAATRISSPKAGP